MILSIILVIIIVVVAAAAPAVVDPMSSSQGLRQPVGNSFSVFNHSNVLTYTVHDVTA